MGLLLLFVDSPDFKIIAALKSFKVLMDNNKPPALTLSGAELPREGALIRALSLIALSSLRYNAVM